MSGCWALDGPGTRSMMPLHRGLRELAHDANYGGGRSGHLRRPALLSHQGGLRAARVLPARRATLTAGPPSRLAARQGFGVYRSFRAASAVPFRAVGRPAPGRGFGWLCPSLCSVPPLGPVGPAPPRPSAARLPPGGLCPRRRGLAALWRLAALVRLSPPRASAPGVFAPAPGPGAVSLRGAGGLMPTRRAASYNATRRAGKADTYHLGGSVPPWAGRCRPGSAGLLSKKCKIGRPRTACQGCEKDPQNGGPPFT